MRAQKRQCVKISIDLTELRDGCIVCKWVGHMEGT